MCGEPGPVGIQTLAATAFTVDGEGNDDMSRRNKTSATRKDEKAEWSSREAVQREFRNPSSEYGPIDCWWWEAGHLDRERMRGQLEEMKEKGIRSTHQ